MHWDTSDRTEWGTQPETPQRNVDLQRLTGLWRRVGLMEATPAPEREFAAALLPWTGSRKAGRKVRGLEGLQGP